MIVAFLQAQNYRLFFWWPKQVKKRQFAMTTFYAKGKQTKFTPSWGLICLVKKGWGKGSIRCYGVARETFHSGVKPAILAEDQKQIKIRFSIYFYISP